ncbi:cardiolipin synthase (CMP-forming) isoform X2 [Anser cygnoides]|uniref:cardiolipin synthase (CMP-forming) isoform X2 n=1 Tax=Anser cygnoides TaxID=8845 RepID=UPI0034D2A2B1
MLAAAWLGRGLWGLLRTAGRRRPGDGGGGGGARPLGSRPGAGGRRHGNGGGFCLGGALGQPQRLLRHRQRPPPPPPLPPTFPAAAAVWSLVGSGAGHRRAGSGGPAPQEPCRQGSGAGRCAEMYENPWTIPNILSMARMGLAPVLGYLIVEENFNVALGVFVLAGVTDLLDGFIARNWANQKSALGSALDPLADKILISVLYVSLTCANLIPVSLTSMIILRDVALIAAVFYVRYKTLSPPMNTAVQLILVAASLAAPVFNYVDSIYLQTLWCITAFTTVTSAYSYYHYGRKTVQVINNK